MKGALVGLVVSATIFLESASVYVLSQFPHKKKEPPRGDGPAS